MLFSKTDLKYTLRLLFKKPGFALLSVIVLAGGLGVSIFSFTALYTLYHKPIPLTNGDSIYAVCAGFSNSACEPFKAFEFSQFRDEIASLENIGIYFETKINVEHEQTIISIRAMRTEWNVFQLSQTRALLGRTLQEFDQEANAEAVVVIGYELWQTQFKGDLNIINTIVNIQGDASRVIGVMPEGYLFPEAMQVWLPMNQEVLNPIENDIVPVFVYSLLKEGVTPKSASQEIDSLMNRNRQRYPANDSSLIMDQEENAYIGTFPETLSGGKTALIMESAAVFLGGCIFLLACINVGTLLLARTNERLKDISIRVALGAPRKRLLFQTMAESILISIIGGVLALLFASAAMELINLWLPSLAGANYPFWLDFHVDGSTIFAVILFVALSVFLSSAIPSWRIINGDFNSVMRDGTRGAVGIKPGRLSRVLVVISITIITVLLFLGALFSGLLFQFKQSVTETDADYWINVDFGLNSERYTPAQKIQWYRRLDSDLKNENTLIKVQINTAFQEAVIEREGQDDDANKNSILASINFLLGSEDAKSISDRSLLEGRFLNDSDNDLNSPAGVVISQTLASNLWPDESPIDHRLRIASLVPNTESPWLRVVGVVSDNPNPNSPLLELDKSEVRISLAQTEPLFIRLRVKANDLLGGTESESVRAAQSLISRTILSLDEDINFSINTVKANQVTIEKLLGVAVNVMIACALFSFLVAIAGIYGLIKNTIQSATQEIGTRRAVGATDNGIINTYLYRCAKQVITGFIIAMLISSPVIYMIIITQGFDFVLQMLLRIAFVITALYACVLFAIYYPIRKVLQMEPSEALRYE